MVPVCIFFILWLGNLFLQEKLLGLAERLYLPGFSYLKEEHETLPWEEVKAQYDNLGYGEGESDKKMNINGVLI